MVNKDFQFCGIHFTSFMPTSFLSYKIFITSFRHPLILTCIFTPHHSFTFPLHLHIFISPSSGSNTHTLKKTKTRNK